MYEIEADIDNLYLLQGRQTWPTGIPRVCRQWWGGNRF